MTTHCTDEGLELYAMGRLDDASTPAIEEHILICENCRVRLDEADRYVRAMRGATLRLRQEASQKRDRRSVFAWNGWLSAPALGAAAVAVFIALFVTTAHYRYARLDTAVVTESLFAQRGATATVPAHHLLDLKLDTRGLNLGSTVEVGLFNGAGHALEHYTSPNTGDFAEIRSSHSLRPGNFFVRIYAPGSKEQLREFALEVR